MNESPYFYLAIAFAAGYASRHYLPRLKKARQPALFATPEESDLEQAHGH
jgi:hypothetical protein